MILLSAPPLSRAPPPLLSPSSPHCRYVEVAVDYMLNKSITKQYNAFAEGFRILCDGPATRLFNAQVTETVRVAHK